ncbi:MAG: alcohol dehydrogenase catalytic domain-containing protein [Thermodesulfobacteriota bacterium]
MKAVQFTVDIPRYLITKALGTLLSSIYSSLISCLEYRDVDDLKLHNEEWAKVKVKYAGICGSDMNLIYLRDSSYASPFTSSRFTMGHENLGSIAELGNKVEGFATGDRVVVDPILPCITRGIEKLCSFCECGELSRCEHFADGNLAPGLIIGTCLDTGGGWSPYFIAHKSQLFKVPDGVSDENAVLIDPFCSALRSVIRNYPKDSEVVLIVGSGVIGLCVVAALRALESKARIVVLAKYEFQGELAEHYGANEVICLQQHKDYFEALAYSLKARVYQPVFGRRVLVGGADLVFECVGNDSSIDDALRFTRTGGKMVLLGLAAYHKKVDWTPIWLKELELRGSFACATENYQGKQIRTYQIALDLMADGKVDLSPLLTHKCKLIDYRQAIKMTAHKRKNRVIKTVFAFD